MQSNVFSKKEELQIDDMLDNKSQKSNISYKSESYGPESVNFIHNFNGNVFGNVYVHDTSMGVYSSRNLNHGKRGCTESAPVREVSITDWLVEVRLKRLSVSCGRHCVEFRYDD